MYAPGALLVPPEGTSWIENTGEAIADFYKEAFTAVPTLTTHKSLFVDEIGGAVHELGNSSAFLPSGTLYYAKWEKSASGWAIATHVLAMGKQVRLFFS